MFILINGDGGFVYCVIILYDAYFSINSNKPFNFYTQKSVNEFSASIFIYLFIFKFLFHVL